MAVASGFGRKVTEALAADPRSICYYEILNETKNECSLLSDAPQKIHRPFAMTIESTQSAHLVTPDVAAVP